MTQQIYLVDDEPFMVKLVTSILTGAGYSVTSSTSSVTALEEIRAQKPDCVITDIMMPEMDGLELCRLLCQDPALSDTKVVVLSGKTFDFDRRRALEFGAAGYIVKSTKPESLLRQLAGILSDDVTLTYWGIRGTLPVPGKRSLRYGGNTPCLTVRWPGDRLFILDAGTGIKELSNHLQEQSSDPITARLLISHPHWDHIHGLPYFAPLYVPGNEIEICGASHGDISVRDLVSGQMEGVYFPITISKFGAQVNFRDLREETFELDGVEVRTMLLSHPGYCLGYRLSANGKTLCYVTDNELFLPDDMRHNPSYVEQLADFVRDADILVTDTCYSDEEYPKFAGYGHSSVGQAARLAHKASVKTLNIFHHDPDQDDDAIDAKLASARATLAELGSDTQCEAPAEGQSITL
jgi:CheY-like chemotaxis protein/phosphoribosyl 1,2-cyclic phosphodiesterase